MAFSSDGSVLAFSTDAGLIEIWNIDSNKQTRVIKEAHTL